MARRKTVAIAAAGLALAALAWGTETVRRAVLVPDVPNRFVVREGVIGFRAGRSVVYLLRGPGGAVLIDTGSDPSARELLAALQAEGLESHAITNVLLTSAHPDHAAAVQAFPDATLWLGEADAALFARDRMPTAPLARLFARFSRANPRRRPHLVRAGEQILAAGLHVFVAHLPCVTPGSVAYIYDSVAFTGSALLRGPEGLEFPSWLLADHPERCPETLSRLLEWPLTMLATGHGAAAAQTKVLAQLSGAPLAPR